MHDKAFCWWRTPERGIDPHFPVAKGQVYPGNNFRYHLIPFEAAFKAGTASIMPYYGVPVDMTSENVGFSFNKEMITGSYGINIIMKALSVQTGDY